jgi:TRAP-type C4-dicarboxylate transport system substrate-binding protein
MRDKKSAFFCMVALFFAFTSPAPDLAKAAPVTLNLVAAFPKTNPIAFSAVHWVEEMNKKGKGEIVVNWKGGPEIIPIFDQPQAVVNGVIDINYAPPNYYAGLLPGADVMELSNFYPADQGPGSSIYEFMVRMYKPRGIRYLGEIMGAPDTGNFLLCMRGQKVSRVQDIVGKKVRVSPLTRHFIVGLKAEPVTIAGPEIYVAMERGVVDGFIWPMYAGFSDMGLQEVTKFVVDHGVYRGPSGFFMNQKAWDKLPKNLQDLVIEVTKETMAWGEKNVTSHDKSERDKAKSAKVEFVKLPDAEGKAYIKASQDALWAYFKTKMPQDRYQESRKLLNYE